MSRRVLDVGNCRPDHAALGSMVENHFAAEVIQAHGIADALNALREARFDLVLVNRELDRDSTDGLEVIRVIKAVPELQKMPVMLVSDYADYQERAIQLGAEPGFGKSQLNDPATREKLRRFLT